ncbi:hypothetical protein V7S43_010658 [Phytophthora oleae]|uniref:Uncharacterized protein n=1 Tax=Phytophthora oleae TaxID=2107226 RepID=A0ABD3FC90_9STRA
MDNPALTRLLDYVANYSLDGDVTEFKDQLSGFTHKDLRAACTELDLRFSKKSNKKSGYISTLISYWKGDLVPGAPPIAKSPTKLSTPKAKAKVPQPMANLPHHPMPMHEPSDVTQYVQEFPPHGDEEELRDQLNGCKAVILRSACVLFDLRPNRKNFAKPNFVTLLVNYWKDSVEVSPMGKKVNVTPRATQLLEPNVTPRTGKNLREEEVEIEMPQKRTRHEFELKETPKKKKPKTLERSGDIFEDEKSDVRSTSLEKALVVKEWAAAMEILSRVDGSTESIASIRALINGVVESAANDL